MFLLILQLESNQVNAPTKVNVNTYLRSIDKIDDYKMVNRLPSDH